MSFIVTDNVTKHYSLGKTTVKAVQGISIEIKKGEYLCIAGPSGAGKSTFLNLLGLLDTPTEGTIMFDDCSITEMKEKALHRFRKKRITFIFQNFNLIPVLTAYENIEFPLLIQKVDRATRRARIEKLTAEVGIAEYLNHRPDELSGGQRQRVAIARALVTNPEVVLADEPTANLDSATGATILDLLKRLNKEEQTTFIIASHDPKIMDQADRVLRIIDGRIAS